MKKYVYTADLEQVKPLITFQLSDFYKGVAVDTNYLDFHNHTCPRCQKNVQVEDHSIQHIGAISGFYAAEKRTVFLYGICISCVNEMAILAHRQTEQLRSARMIENVVLTKLAQITELISTH